jgi:hypothetical protein
LVLHNKNEPCSDATKFTDKICTKRHKKSEQTTKEAPGSVKPEQAYFPESEMMMMMMMMGLTLFTC